MPEAAFFFVAFFDTFLAVFFAAFGPAFPAEAFGLAKILLQPLAYLLLEPTRIKDIGGSSCCGAERMPAGESSRGRWCLHPTRVS